VIGQGFMGGVGRRLQRLSPSVGRLQSRRSQRRLYQERRLCRQDSRERALEFQEFALDVEAAAVAAQGAVRGNHAMAGDDNRQRAPIVRHAHGANTLRAAYRTRNLTVAASLSVGNRQQRSPTRDLKICSSQINLEVELSPFPGKILLQLFGVRLQGVRRFLKANGMASLRLVFRPQITWVGTNGLLA